MREGQTRWSGAGERDEKYEGARGKGVSGRKVERGRRGRLKGEGERSKGEGCREGRGTGGGGMEKERWGLDV